MLQGAGTRTECGKACRQLGALLKGSVPACAGVTLAAVLSVIVPCCLALCSVR